MKKMYGYIVGIIVGLIIIIAFILFITGYNRVKQNETDNINHEKVTQEIKNDNESPKASEASFYLVYEDERVVIYNESDRSFYDYAEINMTEIPAEIREQLKLGLYIDGEENLYNFLQTYSS